MSTDSIAGKIAAHTFESVIAPRLGVSRPEVVVGPRTGIDVGIVELDAGRVMALTTDPLYVLPAFGWERAAWFAVHIIASDAWTSALPPTYLTVDLNLPPHFGAPDLADLWESVHRACSDLGLAIVTGHTGRYPGCEFPIIGAATAIGLGSAAAYLTPAMARPGDALLITKGAAIETTGSLGALFQAPLATAIGAELAAGADALFDQMSIVQDVRAAIGAGVRDAGVTTLHDATERGVMGGVLEIAEASGTGMLVDEAAIPLLPAVRAVCRYFEIDPYTASSEGTLLLTCRAHRVAEVLSRLDASGIDAAIIGEIMPPANGRQVVRHGRQVPLHAPSSDPFWPAMERAVEMWGMPCHR